MRTVKAIINQIKETDELKGLVDVYEEIAAYRLTKIRKVILASRDYFEGLANVSGEVGIDVGMAFPSTQGEAAVFISANSGFYGDIVDKIFASFVEFVKKNKVDNIVVGSLGKTLMESYAKGISYKYYEIPDDKLETADLSLLAKEFENYKKIHVFYGKFKNIVIQESSLMSIGRQTIGGVQKAHTPDIKLNYLYEPSLEKIAEVFAKEILYSLFEQSVKESQLARYASRLMYLDSAIEKIDDRKKVLGMEKTRAVKRNVAKRQGIMVAGLIARNV